jgi:hypothetical protein
MNQHALTDRLAPPGTPAHDALDSRMAVDHAPHLRKVALCRKAAYMVRARHVRGGARRVVPMLLVGRGRWRWRTRGWQRLVRSGRCRSGWRRVRALLGRGSAASTGVGRSGPIPRRGRRQEDRHTGGERLGGVRHGQLGRHTSRQSFSALRFDAITSSGRPSLNAAARRSPDLERRVFGLCHGREPFDHRRAVTGRSVVAAQLLPNEVRTVG